MRWPTGWHYQIGRQRVGGETCYHLVEVYCDEDGQPWSWCHTDLRFVSDWPDIPQTLEMMLMDCYRHGVIDLDEPLPGTPPGCGDDDEG